MCLYTYYWTPVWYDHWHIYLQDVSFIWAAYQNRLLLSIAKDYVELAVVKNLTSFISKKEGPI